MASFASEGFTYLALSFLIVCIRLLIRIRQAGISNLFADDYLMIVALLPYTTETILAYMVGQRFNGLTNSGMTDAERASLSVDSEEYGWRVGGSKIQVAGWCVYVSVIWSIKASLCAFYSRLTVSFPFLPLLHAQLTSKGNRQRLPHTHPHRIHRHRCHLDRPHPLPAAQLPALQRVLADQS